MMLVASHTNGLATQPRSKCHLAKAHGTPGRLKEILDPTPNIDG